MTVRRNNIFGAAFSIALPLLGGCQVESGDELDELEQLQGREEPHEDGRPLETADTQDGDGREDVATDEDDDDDLAEERDSSGSPKADPFSVHCNSDAPDGEDELQYKKCYLNYKNALTHTKSGYRSYYTVKATGTTVGVKLQHWNGKSYITDGTSTVGSGRVAHFSNTHGGWRTRRILVTNNNSYGSFSVATKVQTKIIILISMHGASSSSKPLHSIVEDIFAREGVWLSRWYNWGMMGAGDAVSTNTEAGEISEKMDYLVDRYGQDDPSRIRLLIVGKSAGAVSVWNALRAKWSDFDDLDRVALVLIDTYGWLGTIFSTPFSDDRNLYWAWGSTPDSKLGVWNVYQHRDWPNGASFPDDRVFRNVKIQTNVNHDSIIYHCQSEVHVVEALRYLKGNGTAPARLSSEEYNYYCPSTAGVCLYPNECCGYADDDPDFCIQCVKPPASCP